MNRISALTAMVIAVSLSSVAAAGPIQNLVVVQNFPDVIVAGSGYQAHYTFDNAADEEVTLAFMLNISNPGFPVNSGEFDVWMRLGSEDMSCTEQESGSFVCDDNGEEVAIGPESSHDLYVNISSLPPLYPDTNYSLTLDLITGNPLPMTDIPFARGQGQASDGGKKIAGQAMIYTDEAGKNFRLFVKDRRSVREFSRTYSLVRYSSGWFWEIYQCRDDTGRNFSITVVFRSWVYGYGKNIYFFGSLV
jgi:hypothetical protein